MDRYFWTCEACQAQNSREDGECQFCECDGQLCKRDNCSDPRHPGLEQDSALSRVPCSYCGHPYAEHNEQHQGFWKCSEKNHCVCTTYQDKGWPVPITSWQLR